MRHPVIAGEYVKSNREKSMTAKLGLYWCNYCDCALVGDAKKCPVCGKGKHRKKRKGV